MFEIENSDYEDAFVKKIQIFLDHPEQGYYQPCKEFQITNEKTNLDPKNLISLMAGSFQFSDLTKSKGMMLVESFTWVNDWQQHLDHLDEPDEYDDEEPSVDYMFYDFTENTIAQKDEQIKVLREALELAKTVSVIPMEGYISFNLFREKAKEALEKLREMSI